MRKWRGRLLNVHPSLLPAFKGSGAVGQALAAGVRVSGCTVHFVEEAVDAGAVLVQEVVEVSPADTEASLTEKIHRLEHRAFPRALELLASGRVSLDPSGKARWH